MHRSISSIDKQVWNSILSDNDIFNTHDFVHTVENAGVENASFWYLLFYDGERLEGHTVLSAFNISLDLFISASKLVHVIKKVGPDFFTVKILFCGLPASFGQMNLQVRNRKYEESIALLVSTEMERIAADEKINLLCIKEFKGDEADRFKSFLAEDFFKAYSLPYMKLDLQWNSFADYLQSLRHPYRRAILRSLKKTGFNFPRIYKYNELSDDLQKPILVLSDITLHSPEDLFEWYLPVMDRTPTRLETLNQEFFKELQVKYRSNIEILSVKHEGKILSVGILLQHKDELTFMLVGRKNARDDADSYFNLVYGIIELAISRGLRRINFGQTAYWVKQRVGANPEHVYIFLKSRKPFNSWLLKRLNSLIFPNLKLKPINVFREPVVKSKQDVELAPQAYEKE